MNNNNSSQNKADYPHIIQFFERKIYSTQELLRAFYADFSDLIYQYSVIPPELYFAAIRVSIPHLYLLITVVPSSNHYKVFSCDHCPTLGQNLMSILSPLIKNAKNNPGAPLFSKSRSSTYSDATKQFTP